MKKTTKAKPTRAKTLSSKNTTKKVVKSKAVKARPAAKSKVVAKKTVKSVAKRVPKKAVAKKTTQKKGVVHHAKRVYHMTPKFIHGMLAGAFVGVVVVTSLGYRGPVHADTDQSVTQDSPAAIANGSCTVKTDSTKNGAGTGRKFAVGSGKATITFTVTGDANCTQQLALKSWYAPSADGTPNAEQVLYREADLNAHPGAHQTMSVVLPVPNTCYYQIDFVQIAPYRQPGQKSPILGYTLGGDHNCLPPKHSFACTSNPLPLKQSDVRKLEIADFTHSQVNATYVHSSIQWGDGSSETRAAVKGATHQYVKDGTYTVTVTPSFTYKSFTGTDQDTSAPCTGTVTYSSAPTTLSVCRLADKQIVTIDKNAYDASKYSTDLTKCDTTTPTPTPTPSTTPTPSDTPVAKTVSTTPTALVNTGPGAVLIIFGLSIIGGYVFHMRHRHVRHRKHAAHHAK